MSFITNLFYLCAVFFIILELGSFQEPKKIIDFRMKLRKNKNFSCTGLQSMYLFSQALYMVWTLIGLMSSQWLLFMLIIILSIVNAFFKIGNVISFKLDCILCMCTLGFILLNKYQFHINIFQLLSQS